VTRRQPTGSTVFISYARDDDDTPPLKDAPQGWVSFFWEQLRWALIDAGMPQAKLWLDRYQIEPAEVFTEKIEDALKQACLIIPILSANWVQRDWCLKELSRFVELRPATGREDIILVKKNEPPEADVPEPLKNRVGYKFFNQDPTGKVRDFYWAGLRDQAAYYEVLKRITDWIVARLNVKPRTKPTKFASNGRVVYLAAPADELRDAWQRIANDLEGSGYIVLPRDGRLPDTAAEAEAAIRNGLAKAVLSVHFLGESQGWKPGGSDETVVLLQLRIARQQHGQIPRVLWAPKWLPERRELRRDPFEVLNRFGGLLRGEEVYAEEATDLSQWLRAKLEPPKPIAAATVQRLLITGAVPDDDDLVAMLANLVQSDEIKVKALFAGEAAAVHNLEPPSCVIALWGEASGPAITTLLDAVEPFGRRFILCLSGGDEAAKRRFFREGIFLERLDALPADRDAARLLLIRLEILEASEKADT
jgi:hypothetical protein